MSDDAMTVAELIDLLQRHAPPDALVESDGCDCYGAAVGIRLNPVGTSFPGEAVVLISRGEDGDGLIQPERLQPKPDRRMQIPKPR